MKAVIVGGSGATGLELVKQLIESQQWERIVSLARRELPLPPELKSKAAGRLVERTINFENLAAEGQGAFERADVVFWTLGTTRGQAGSAERFVRVDRDYVIEGAKLAKEAGVKHFSLLTAAGSNPNVWAGNFTALHPLLYARTKGQAEEAVKQQGFERVSIFRPGLLDRGSSARGVEGFYKRLVSSLAVADLAACMLRDAEARGSGTRVFEMKRLLAASKAGAAP